MRRQVLSAACVAGAILCAADAARGDDFHVESQVYKLGEAKPVITTVTLFVNGVVYDFMQDPNAGRDPEVTIFDPAGRRCLVLDPDRKICTELSLDQVGEFSKQLRIAAAGAKDPILNFLSNPQFKEKVDGDQMEFESAWMIYKLKTTPAKNAEVSRQYAEFSFWHGQLNVMINPQSLPPFGRMAVSEKLEQQKLLPTEVFMTVSPKGPVPKLSLRAEHRFQWTLIEADRKMVDEAHKQIKTFQAVPLKEYNEQRAVEVAKGPADKQSR